jgi:hypothetical protein
VTAGYRRADVSVQPVGGGPAAVEQPGCGEDERSGADRHNPCAAVVGGPDGLDQVTGRAHVAVVAGRHDHGVSGHEIFIAVL